MAGMSVIGIDFGNESCFIAAARAGGIETIANDYSLRATPSCVAFSDRNRILGVAAKNQTVTNMKNTIHGFKRLIGREFKDPHVQDELKYLPYNVSENPDGSIGIKVKYLNEDRVFTPEQITAMLLTKLRETSEIALQCNISDCVLSVPSFYTNAERKALLDAAKVAGLRVLRLFNETTATALTYGIYKQDLPNPDDAPRNVVFVDCGHSSLQVFACAFHKEKLKIIASAANPYLGGRNIDYKLAKHFSQEFKQKYNIEPESNPRAFLRLLTEVEKLKKQMSANSTKLPFGIECFMNDIDVKGEMCRSEMEELCKDVFENVEKTLKDCLEKSKLALSDIHSVEIVGGSSRIPAIKGLIEKIFQKTPSTTLNQDEAVARGCALQCAMLSPAVRVRDFSVTDLQVYPVVMEWDPSPNEPKDSKNFITVFPEMHAAPFSKKMTFYQNKPFAIQLYYEGNVPYPSKFIGKYQINDVKPGPDNASQKVTVKVRVNMDGVIGVIAASMVEKVENSGDTESMDVENTEEENGQKQEAGSENTENKAEKTQEGQSEDAEKKAAEAKKKVVSKTLDLTISATTHGLSPEQLNAHTELEGKMIADDKLEKERIDARNCLEEYVYDLRNKLGSEEEFALYIAADDASKLSTQLDETENWLYEEGADVNKSVYISKLDELKAIGEKIRQRKVDYEEKTKAFENIFCSIQIAQKKISMFKEGDERLNHLDAAEITVVEEKVANALKWAENAQSLMNEFTDRTKDAPVPTSEIKNEMQNLNNAVNPVFSKPKPQPKVEKKENGVQQNGETEEHMDDSSPKAETKAEPDTKEPEAAATN
ncbi:hypothetical protein M8J76_010096 [Diaphorina citri]|nr:hypothetical protein M8J75_001564 [Diaphorina citri]KAI5726871.1 hypothetical protein M8J76_010096 [Diaphorina citri]KAI5731202.1 hypothetical protein M8J77_006269 [Diaphorina citri]